MGSFIVTGPDGKKYRVNGPEGSTGEQAVDYIKKQIGTKPSGDIFDIGGDISRDVSAGWEDIKRGFAGTHSTDIGEQIMAVPHMAGGAWQAATALPAALTSHPFGRAVSKTTGGMIEPEQAETALMALGPRRTGPVTGGTPRTLAPEAPTREMLDMTSSAGYKTLNREAARLDAGVVSNAVDGWTSMVDAQGFPESNPHFKPVYDALRRLKKDADRPAEMRSTKDIEGVRQELNNLDASPRQRAAAEAAKEIIDDWLENIPHISDLAKATRSDYAAMKRSERLTGEIGEGEQMGAVERAELQAASSGMGFNLENALRQRVKSILFDRKLRRGLSQGEIDVMEAIVRGDNIQNVARIISRLGPTHPLFGWGTALGSLLAGHADWGMLTLGTGELARRLGIGRTRKLITELDEALRKRSALGQSMPTSTTTAPTPRQTVVGGGISIAASGSGRQNDPKRFYGTPDQMERSFRSLPPGSFFVNPSDNRVLQKPY